MSGMMGGLLSSYSIDAPATLVYNLDAAALGGRLATTITTSASFDGTTQYLTLPSTGTNTALIQSGDFTVEAWYYPTNVTGSHSLFTLGPDPDNRYTFQLSGTSVTSNLYGFGVTTYTSTVPISTWTHIAVVRSGTTVSVYINGTASATTDTQAGTIGNGAIYIGADATGGALFAGNISNFRMTNTAVYTASFTVSTTTLRAVTGTQVLLPLMATPFMDLSTNLLTVTNTGTIVTAVQAPALTTGTTDLTGTYTLTSSIPLATFTGSSTGTTLTVASGLTGTVTLGMTITGGSIPAGTYIVSQLTGTTGSTGTYTISASVTQASTSITGARVNWFGSQGGIFSNYFSGDGIGAYITGGPNIAAATKYTVMMAYQLIGTSNYGRLLNSNTSSPDWLMGGYSSYPKAWFSNGVTINLSGATKDTVWHIDFVTFTRTVGNIYSSTSAQPTSTPTYTNTSSTISGFNQLKLFSKSDGNECAAGNIGMVKVWTGVLSTAQMQAEYNAYKARFGY
jgi:Concanavalin A-like lectin/glucanases superfamily